MKNAELTNETATNDRGAKGGIARSATIAALFSLVSLSATLVGCATGHSEQQQAHGTAQAATADWKAVEQAMGRSGARQPGDVYRFSMPRGDLKVTAKGVEIKPALALGSWAAFKMMDKGAMVMGDIVMTEDEVNPVISRLQQGGIEQTAVHHHITGESPRILYVHIGGHGDPVKLAETIKSALALTKTPAPAPPGGQEQPSEIAIDTKQIEQVLGYSGKINGGVFQVTAPRAEKITEAGMDVPPSMGTGTAMNFQPTGSGKAAITGDFVMLASEVNPVIRALRENGIEVTSLHNHMLNDEPRLFFMHFWANDDAVKLARGLKAALDKTNSAQGQAK